MVQQAQRDPVVESLLKLARDNGFRQEGGITTSRAQVTRNLRPYNRDAVNLLTRLFLGAEEAQKTRAASSRASELRARTPGDLQWQHLGQGALRRLEARRAKHRERDETEDLNERQVKAHLGLVVEDQARLAQLQQEHMQTKEQAICMFQLLQRGRRLRPELEKFTKEQWGQIQAVRDRMSGEAETPGDATVLERIGQLCGQVQQELWLQLNSKSMAAAAASSMPGTLTLTYGGESATDAAGALSVHLHGSTSHSVLETELHLPRTSQLRRPICMLLQLPPHKFLKAITQLARDTRNNLARQLGSWDLLADARRRCHALQVVDPLHDIRKMQQEIVEFEREMRRLEVQLKAAKLRLLELASRPCVRQALANPLVKERIQVEGHRAMLHTTRAQLEVLRRDAAAQEPLMQELLRLEAEAEDHEREEGRLGGMVNLLMNSLDRVLTGWQQQHAETKEFLQSLLPKAYDDLIDAMGQNTDRLARSVTELMRVPPELLPVLAEQRRAHRMHNSADEESDIRDTGLPAPTSLPLSERLRLALPYIGNQRSAAMLRAAAGVTHGSNAHLHAHETSSSFTASHGSLLHVSTASVSSSQGGRSSTGDGSAFRSGILGSGTGNAGGGGMATSGPWAGAGVHSATATSTASGSWSGPGQNQAHAVNGGGGGGAMTAMGSWLPSAPNVGSVSVSAIAWGPGPAALGLPGWCYYLATAAVLDPLAPLRCPVALARSLYERLRSSEQVTRWLADADARLKSRQRELAALAPANAALRERLDAKRHDDMEECVARLARSRRDMMASLEAYAPRVEMAMRASEEQGALRLVPWRKVDNLTAAEMLDEIRSLFARIAQLQQPHQPLHEHIYGNGGMLPPGASMGF